MPEAPERRTRRAILLIGVVAIAIIGLSLFFLPLGGDPSTESFTVGGHPLYGQPAPEDRP